jgi:hypothetical protein
VPRRSRCIRPFPPTTRAFARRGIFVRRRLLSSRGGRSRGHGPSSGARVFRPRSRGTDPSCGMLSPGGDRAAAGSLRPSAGRANEEAMPRARDVTPRCGPPVSSRRSSATEPGSRPPVRVFSAHRRRDPARLPRIRSTAGGPAAEARLKRPTIRRTQQPRAHSGLSTFASHCTLSRRE